MAELNTDFWSVEQEDYPGIYGMKRFEKTLKDMILDGDIPLNQSWDTSISPWVINYYKHPDANYNCDLTNKCWFFPDVNRMIGISPTAPADPDMAMKIPMYTRKDYYPFMFYSGDAGQGNGWTFPYWPGRVGYDQSTSTGDFTNYKYNLYIPSSYDYSRLCWLIQVYVSDYGHNIADQHINDWGNGMWMDLASVTDEIWTDLYIGAKDISGVRFLPYYATSEDYPNNRRLLTTSGFAALTDHDALDGSATGFGVDAPYTDDFIDYMLSCYAAYGTSDSEASRGGYPTLALGNIGFPIYNIGNTWRLGYLDIDYNWHPFTSLADWCSTGENFTKTGSYQINATDSPYWINLIGNGGSWHTMYYRQYLNVDLLGSKSAMIDYLCTQCAYLGCWFATDSSVITTEEMSRNNPDAYIGIIEDDGTTRGRYQRGSAIDTPQEEWVDPWDYSPWVPPVDPDPTDWDEDQRSVISLGSGDPSYGTKEYLMTQNALDELIRVLQAFKWLEGQDSGIIPSPIPDGTCEFLFGSSDPMEAIISVVKYPFDMITDWTDGRSIAVTGTYATSSVDIANYSIPITSTPNILQMSVGATEVYEITWDKTQWGYGTRNRFALPYFDKFKNFLDYEPYCTASLYVPFCGSVRIDPEVYAGHNVRVEYFVSPIDGTCKAYIMRDSLVIDTLTGNMGTFIALNSTDELERSNNVNLLNAQIKAEKMNMAKSFATCATGMFVSAKPQAKTKDNPNGTPDYINTFASPVGTIFDVMQSSNNIDMLRYQLAAVETPFKQLQTGGGFLSAVDEYGIRLVAYRPTTLTGYTFTDWGDYPHTTGFACLINDNLTNYSGYTECTNIITDGIGCTEAEASMIRSAFASGVYL